VKHLQRPDLSQDLLLHDWRGWHEPLVGRLQWTEQRIIVCNLHFRDTVRVWDGNHANMQFWRHQFGKVGCHDVCGMLNSVRRRENQSFNVFAVQIIHSGDELHEWIIEYPAKVGRDEAVEIDKIHAADNLRI